MATPKKKKFRIATQVTLWSEKEFDAANFTEAVELSKKLGVTHFIKFEAEVIDYKMEVVSIQDPDALTL